MAVPRNRNSNSRKNNKRSHHAKVPKLTAACGNCGKPRLSHRICPFCGQYNGRSIVQKETE